MCSLQSVGWLLNRPMAGVEAVLNNLVLSPITSVIGFPLVLNATKKQANGIGLTVKEAGRIAGQAKKQHGAKIIRRLAKLFGYEITIK